MRVAVVGATGAVGTLLLALLERRGFPADEIVPFASERSAGRELVLAPSDFGMTPKTLNSYLNSQIAGERSQPRVARHRLAAVAAACRGGASGMLAGRALWTSVLAADDPTDLLRERSVPRLHELAAIVDAHGRPWREKRA